MQRIFDKKITWQTKKLGEVCEVIAGQSPEGKYYNSSGKGLPFYQGKKEFTEKYLGAPTTWTTNITKEAQDGDILMSVRAPVGPVNFSTSRICIGRGLTAIRPSKSIDNEFLFNFLIKHENEIIGNAGAVFNSINKRQIEDILISLPSVPEQKRIVAILDKAFVALAKAKENAEKNLENACELFESYLQSVFANPGRGWEEKKLGEVCGIVNGGTPDTKVSEYWDGKHLWMTPKDMGKLNDIFVNDTARKITDTGLKNSSAKLLPINSVILSSRAPIGYLAINKKEMSTNQGCKGMVPKKELDALFLYYFLKKSVELLNSLGSGTTFKELSGTKLAEVKIPLPPTLEQKRIVTKFGSLSIETKKLEAIYQQKLVDLEELKKSVLQKAFAGKFVGACS